MRAFVWIMAIFLSLVPMAAEARVQEGDVCWEPDIEFPVPCDEDEE